jgi:DivIVA domain-containing protein
VLTSTAAVHGTIGTVMWLEVIVLVVVIGAVAVVVAGRSDAMVEVYDDRPDTTLPTSRLLTADDIAGVRFSTGVRGYRMDEVDAFVERVQQDLLARRSELDSREQDRTGGTGLGLPHPPPTPPSGTPTGSASP